MKLKTILLRHFIELQTLHLLKTRQSHHLTGKPYESPTNLDTSLPDLGDISQTVLTPQDEQYIGDQIMREVAVSDEVLQDVEVNDYLQTLG